MSLDELKKMFMTVTDLYEKNDPCVRDVSLFLRMHYVLKKKLAKTGAEESKPIQDLLTVLRSKFIATFLQVFGHQTPMDLLYRMFGMLMELYKKGEQRDVIESLFPEMHGILKEKLDLAGADVAGDEDGDDEEYKIIQNMISRLESLMP